MNKVNPIDPKAKISVRPIVGRETVKLSVPEHSVILADLYSGPYEITPSDETQILSTKKFQMEKDVVINPIPSNYGKIIWDGATMKIV